MKKLILAILVATGLTVLADSPGYTVLMTGQRTNTTIMRGTNAVVVLNSFLAGQPSFLTTATNLGSLVTNINPQITSTQVGVVAGFFSAGVCTNQYFFNGSYDKIHWDALTNVQIYGPGGSLTYSNYTITLGQYQYLQCANITNLLGSNTSNYLAFFFK